MSIIELPFSLITFRNIGQIFMVGFLLVVILSCGDDEPEAHPLVGKWRRDFYQFKNLPIKHKNYENLIIPSHYVPGTSGIYNEDRYDLIFHSDRTFDRTLVYPNLNSYVDKGRWNVQGNQLILDSETSTQDELYTLHSNSGQRMALYQEQTWWLLPDVVIDTLSENYFEANSEMLFNQYATEAELNMYFFFEKIE